MSSKAIIIENMVMASVADIYIEYNLGLDYVNNIFLSDEKYIELLEQNIKKYKKDLELVYFKTLEEACEYFGVPFARVKARINYTKKPYPDRSSYRFGVFRNRCSYWTISQALEVTEPPQSYKSNRSKETIVDGKVFKSRSEACKYYGIPQTYIVNRLKAGWTMDEAYEVVPRAKKR